MTAQNPELEDLIVAIGQGDRAAFHAFYAATSPKLLGLVFRLVGSRPSAEEIVQDVYLKVWTSAKGYTPQPGSGFGWLASIARNRTIDIIRVKVPKTVSPSSSASIEDGASWYERIADPTNAEAHFLQNDELKRCLSTIDEPVRDLILLAYYVGHSREELAQRYSMPVNTVKTWLHRGLAALKSCLEAKT